MPNKNNNCLPGWIVAIILFIILILSIFEIMGGTH